MRFKLKILLALLMFSLVNGLQNLGAVAFYKATFPAAGSATEQQKQNELTQPDNKPRVHKVYPPVTPGQPHPDRISPGNNSNQHALPTDTTRSQQAPRQHKAKLAGEQSNPQ